MQSKEKEFNQIDNDLIKDLNYLITSITDIKKKNEQSDEYQKLLLSKENEISRLNDINQSNENEKKNLNKLIEDLKAGTAIKDMEDNFKKEKAELMNKINNLELKIYNINEENKKLTGLLNANKNNEQENNLNEENKNEDNMKYEELVIMKNEFEEQNKKVNNNTNRFENIEFENLDIIQKVEELKKLVEEYETGKIIPESTKKSLDELKNKNLTEIEELKSKYELLNQKNESKIKELNNNIFNNSKMKKELENLIIRQEKKIEDLNSELSKKTKEIKNKNISISKNETYSLHLINIINEQKSQIQKLKSQKKAENLSEIAEMTKIINQLENKVQIRDGTINTMRKVHKKLQDKYIKMCFGIKKKEQDDLINQAKFLHQQKMKIDTTQSLDLKNTRTNKKKLYNIRNITEKNDNISSNDDYLNTNMNDYKDIILPNISNNKNINEDNKMIDLNGENDRLDEINNVMSKIIEEN